MYDEKLKDWIRENILDKNGNPQGRSFTVRQKKNVRECDIILELTSFLENDCSIAERIYYVMNDLDRKVLCFNKGCDKFVSFNGYKYGYSTYCSSICAVNDDTIKEKMRNTNLERYGVKYASQLETFKDKSKKTWKILALSILCNLRVFEKNRNRRY